MTLAVKPLLQEILADQPSAGFGYQRNILKGYLQVVVLDFMYKHPRYQELFFYGGSCLAQCYGLPRLSEDLDFVDAAGRISLIDLAADLAAYFKKETDGEVKTTIQKFRVYLKFPILKALGLAKASESDLLFLKVEIFPGLPFPKKYETVIAPLFKFNRSVLIKTFDLPTLFATKLRAVLLRKWEKRAPGGELLARAKGRDYFDLMWYLDRGVKPNVACIPEVKNFAELKSQLLAVIDRLDESGIRLDLEPLISDNAYVEKLGKNLKDILRRQVREMV